MCLLPQMLKKTVNTSKKIALWALKNPKITPFDASVTVR
jgi:hypothetical protein